MNTVIGGIEIRMLADLAGLKRDMDQAKTMVGSASKSMQAGADVIKGAFVGIASGLSVAAFVSWMRSAIDAADATKAFAQKTGLAAKDVAGLQLAFKQGGVESGALTTSISKLSKQMVEGNKTFDDLGINTRNADGSMRSTKAVLYETADAFAGMKDGAAKTALAVELFGKAGVDMIPTLNEGSEGLGEMADMAEKLGLVIDTKTSDAADRFNDTTELLGLGLQGIARQAMAQLLPALNNVAGALLTTMTSGDTLRQVSDVLAAGMKGLFTVFMGGVQIVNTFGKTVGALGAQLVALATGDFKGMMDVGKVWMDDIKGDWSTTIKNIGTVWDGSAGASVAAMAKTVKSGREAAEQTKEQEAAGIKAAAAASKHTEELRKLSNAGRDYLLQQMDKNDVTQTEIDLGRALTESEKQQLDLTHKLADGKLLMSAATEAAARAEINLAGQLAANKQWLKDTAAENAAAAEALDKKTAAIVAETEKQREANGAFGLSAQRLGELKVARLLEMATAADKKAQWEEEYILVDGATSAQRDLAQAYRDAAGVATTGAHLAAAKEAADAWQKTADDIGQGLTDSLFRAFESGKGFFSTMWDGIKNLFNTTVLKVIMQPVQTGITSAVGGALGLGGTAANAAGGAGGMGNLLSTGASLLGSLGTFGSAAGYGASALFGGTGLSALSGAASMIGAGSMAGGLGMMAGVLGPIALGLMAVTALLKDKSASLGFGSATAGADGISNGSRMFGFGNGNDIGAQAQLQGVAGSILASVASAAASFGGSASGLSLQAATDVDRKGKGSAILGYLRGGELVSALQTGGTNAVGAGATAASKIDAGGLSDWFAGAGSAAIVAGLQQSDLAPRFREFFGSVAAYSLTKADADAMLAAAAGVQDLSNGLAPLGGVFTQLGSLGVQATIDLASLTGGLDAFVAKAQQYVKDFYSTDEQMAIQAAQVQQALKAAGLDSTIASKADFRALVDSRDISTSDGQRQLAALLNVSGQFAQLADYLGTTGQTLAEIADTAPQIAMLEQSASQTALAQQSVDGLMTLNDNVTTLGDRITAGLDSVRASFEAGLAAVAESTAATSRRLDSWDDGGSLVTTPAA